jgi:hypothetical protein
MIFGTNLNARPRRTNEPTRPSKALPLEARSDTENGKVTPVKSIAVPIVGITCIPPINFIFFYNTGYASY